MVGGHHGECGARAYNGSPGAEPEAESILVIGCPTEPVNLAPFQKCIYISTLGATVMIWENLSKSRGSGEPLAPSWGRPCLSHTRDSVCSTWLDSRTALLNSSPSAVSHSSSNVGVSGEQYPRLRARSITQLARWRSDRRLGETAPCAGGLCTSDERRRWRDI